MSKTFGLNINFCQIPPTVLLNTPYCSTAEMTSSFKTATWTRTLSYVLQSQEIYSEEPITSSEILSEPALTQDDSVNTI